jgi:maleamate amidohydrolase
MIEPPIQRETRMTEAIWDRYMTERDKQVMAALGYGAPGGFGKRPALLVIDVNYAFCGDRREPILESIKRWRTSCGEDAWDALPLLQRLIRTARDREVPVIYTTGIERHDRWDTGSWQWKTGPSTTAGKSRPTNLDGNQIMPQIAPGPRDIVIQKRKPSGFFGTDLASYLVLLGCDSVIVTGTTTSGCVRATVLDAFSNNYRVAVVADGCFDRLQTSHAASLCDMNAKYADIVSGETALEFLAGLPTGMFALPKGNPIPAEAE